MMSRSPGDPCTYKTVKARFKTVKARDKTVKARDKTVKAGRAGRLAPGGGGGRRPRPCSRRAHPWIHHRLEGRFLSVETSVFTLMTSLYYTGRHDLQRNDREVEEAGLRMAVKEPGSLSRANGA